MTQHSRDTPQFYLTAPSPCPYLPGRRSGRCSRIWSASARPSSTTCSPMAASAAASRSPTGRPARPAAPASRCASSSTNSEPTRSMRRVAERNADMIGDMRAAVPTSEQYSVFRAYLDSRHRDGGMADMTVLDYAMMVEDSHVETRLVEYRRRGPDSVDQRPRRRRAARGGADRRARRRPVDGLFVLRSGRSATARSAPS